MRQPRDFAQWRPTLGWAARILGVQLYTVRKLIKDGRLSEPESVLGEKLLNRDEVFALKGKVSGNPMGPPIRALITHDGVLHSRLFAHFVEGRTLQEIVILEKVSPKVVREVYAEYKRGTFEEPPPPIEEKRARAPFVQSRLEIIAAETQAKLAEAAARERVKDKELDIAIERNRRLIPNSERRADTERSRAHAQTMRAIAGVK